MLRVRLVQVCPAPVRAACLACSGQCRESNHGRFVTSMDIRFSLTARPCTHKPCGVIRLKQCLLCPYSDRLRAEAQYVAMGRSRRLCPISGRSGLLPQSLHAGHRRISSRWANRRHQLTTLSERPTSGISTSFGMDAAIIQPSVPTCHDFLVVARLIKPD